MVQNRKLILPLALIALLAQVSTVALAQQTATNPGAFALGDVDLARWLIHTIFGDTSKGLKIPVLGPAMEVLNNFALTFGTLLFTYVAIVGTVNTAHSGQLLGGKWNSSWLPVRYMAGTAVLVPLTTGYSTAQHFVLWLALTGSGGASTVWQAAVQDFSAAEATKIVRSAEYRSSVQLMVKEVLKAEVCAARNNLDHGQSVRAYGIRLVPQQTGVLASMMQHTYRRTVAWGALDPSYGDTEDVCGKILTTRFTELDPGNFKLTGSSTWSSPSTWTSAGADLSGMSSTKGRDSVLITEARAAGRRMVDGQVAGVFEAATSLRPLAEKLAVDPTSVAQRQIVESIELASEKYVRAAEASTRAAVGALDARLSAFTDASARAGWIMAAASFFQMAQIQSSARRLLEERPTVDIPSSAAGRASESIEKFAVQGDIDSMAARIEESFKGDANDQVNPGEWLALKLAQGVSVDPGSSKHALVQIKDAGDTLITAVEVVALGSAGLSAASSAGVKVAGAAIGKATGMLSTLGAIADYTGPAAIGTLIATFGVGIVMAFILPMMPFIMMMGSIVGWLMALFSAVVAVPVWIAGHLHPDGDDLAGKGVGGYMILLETVTRPMFIVLGLLGAFMIMDPVIKVGAILFKVAMSGNEGNSTTGLAAIVTLAVIYVTICFTTVRTTTSLIYVLSETVYRWIGGQHAGMEQAREFTDRSDNAVRTGVEQARAIAAGAAASGRARSGRGQGGPRDETSL